MNNQIFIRNGIIRGSLNITFRLEPNASINGTSFHDVEVTVNPKKLIALLGQGNDGDEYKVSKQWILKSENGNVFRLYDYKETSLYDAENPSPKSFWSKKSVTLHIGGFKTSILEQFALAAWLEEKCN